MAQKVLKWSSLLLRSFSSYLARSSYLVQNITVHLKQDHKWPWGRGWHGSDRIQRRSLANPSKTTCFLHMNDPDTAGCDSERITHKRGRTGGRRWSDIFYASFFEALVCSRSHFYVFVSQLIFSFVCSWDIKVRFLSNLRGNFNCCTDLGKSPSV